MRRAPNPRLFGCWYSILGEENNCDTSRLYLWFRIQLGHVYVELTLVAWLALRCVSCSSRSFFQNNKAPWAWPSRAIACRPRKTRAKQWLSGHLRPRPSITPRVIAHRSARRAPRAFYAPPGKMFPYLWTSRDEDFAFYFAFYVCSRLMEVAPSRWNIGRRWNYVAMKETDISNFVTFWCQN